MSTCATWTKDNGGDPSGSKQGRVHPTKCAAQLYFTCELLLGVALEGLNDQGIGGGVEWLTYQRRLYSGFKSGVGSMELIEDSTHLSLNHLYGLAGNSATFYI